MQQGTCDADNCDRQRVARGLCMMHYQRSRAGRPVNLPDSLDCPSCGETFKPKFGHQIYCMTRCRDRAKARRANGYPNVVPNTKTCLLCDREFVRDGKAVKYCSPDCRRVMANIRVYKRTAGLTEARYRELVQSQAGLCAICRKPPASRRVLFIDHDHTTGRVRALLCHNCNAGLGHFLDDPDRLAAAVAYLATHADR